MGFFQTICQRSMAYLHRGIFCAACDWGVARMHWLRGRWQRSMQHAALRRQALYCASLGLGLLLAAGITWQLCAQLAFAETCADIRTDTLRLHIVANSNSVRDQTVKLQVRDAVLALMAELYPEDENTLTQAQSTALVLQNLPRFALAASQALSAAGVQQQVQIDLRTQYFATTEYDGFTLPAGEYTALCITLGDGAGRNWWCVLYPSLCLASASGSASYPEESETQLICGDYALRFALVEWWQEAKQS